MSAPTAARMLCSSRKLYFSLHKSLRLPHIVKQTRELSFSTTWNQRSRSKISNHVCQSPDNSMIMCWHPEQDFPYEHTQPLVRDKTEMTEGESVLKVQYLLDDKLKNCPEGPTDEELSKLFYTSKRAWRPRPRHDKRVKMRSYTPIDREGL